MKKFPDTLLGEFSLFKKIDSPLKVQDFLEKIPFNFEYEKICRSPRLALQGNSVSCIEASMIAVAAFWFHSRRSFLIDLKTTPDDVYHVITVFKQGRYWGAISKSNHAFLRYRDPVYLTVRELVMSYFNEYFIDNGKKTLRSYSQPFDLLKLNSSWLTADDDTWRVVAPLDRSRHFQILKSESLPLRLADPIERKVGKLEILKDK